MIKQDFISKYIQELNKTLARIISLEIGNADEGFLIIFNQMLQSYYKIDDNNLSTLLEENEERDQFLLADELKIKGKVVNMPDGSVYIEAQSTDEASLEQFISGVESSPSPAGRVDEMEVSEMKPKEYSRFSVMYR